MTHQSTQYDYIIAGAGCAGLSLLFRLLKDPVLSKKKILLLDKNKKNSNDRTWCYWEKEKGTFEEVVTHHWDTLAFMTPDFEKQFDLEGYSYKMIKGLDFYQYVLNYAKEFNNVTLINEAITGISSTEGSQKVTTTENEYTATYVFNSTGLFNPDVNTKNSFLQHFEGWVIKTKEPQFDSKVGTLMDFRLSQKHGITFMYVLPTSSKEALVEYTLFSEKVLEPEEYKQELKDYIKDYLNINEYEILHREFGIIPMSLAKFKRNPTASKNIVNIGTAGGFTKASSGYTFQFIQKNMEYLGADNPIGTPSASSTLSAPSDVIIADGTSEDISLTVGNGNVGIFVTSMEINGPNAADFSISAGELTNQLLNANSAQTMTVALAGTGANRSAVLTINYGNGESIAVNLAKDINLPRSRRNEEEKIIPTKAEIKALIENVPERHKPLIITAILTGMRASELRGLIWDHIDFENTF